MVDKYPMKTCTTVAILEHVIFVLWIFLLVGHQMEKTLESGPPVGIFIVGSRLRFKMAFWIIETTTALQASKVQTFWYGNE